MLQKSILVVCVALVLGTNLACNAQDSASNPQENDFRFWTTSAGQRSGVKLQLVGQSETTVKLKRQDNGKVVELRTSQLSRDDQTYLRNLRDKPQPLDRSIVASSQSDWSRYRGPNGNGKARAKDLPIEWSDTKNVRWKAKLPGPGLSSPVVWGNNIYVTCFSGYEWANDHEGKRRIGELQRHLVCIDLASGDIKWNRSDTAENYNRDLDFADRNTQLRAHGFASNTPCCDKDGVYAYFAADGLFAFSHDGEPLWNTSCGKGFNRTGSASSPVVFDGHVFISAHVESNRLLAIDTKTGEPAWELRGHGCYATPVIRQTDRPELLVRSRGMLKAINPQSGDQIWEGPEAIGESNTSMLIVGNTVYSSDHQLNITATDQKGEILWKKRGGAYYGVLIHHEGNLYSANNDGILTCLNASTGDRIYQKRLPATGSYFASPVMTDGKLYCVSREQGICVVRVGSDYELLAHNTFASDDSKFDGTPAIANNSLILRSNKFLYCIAK